MCAPVWVIVVQIELPEKLNISQYSFSILLGNKKSRLVVTSPPLTLDLECFIMNRILQDSTMILFPVSDMHTFLFSKVLPTCKMFGLENAS